MADNIINARFKQRYDTEANWKSKNPILLAGEMAISSDSSSNLNNFNYKIGDGVSSWMQLPYSYSEGIVLPSSGSNNKNKWIKFASIDLSNVGAWRGCNGILMFFPTESTTVTGLLKFQFRNGGTAGIITSNNLIWISLNDSSYINSVCVVSTGDGTRDLYYQPISDYDSTAIVAANIYNRKQFTLQSDGKYIDSVVSLGKSYVQSYASTSNKASTATALTSSAGSATQPVYFSDGKPVATTYTLGKSVPSDAVFTDTKYTHPTTPGNKHIPSGGSSGQILKWSADGTAVWTDHDIPSIVTVEKGGTGATTKSDARINLGAINAIESADEPTDQNTGDLWFELVEEISL